jgi:hypothetical protein
LSAIIIAVRTEDQLYLALYTIAAAPGPDVAVLVGKEVNITSDFTCISMFEAQGKLFAIAGSRDGVLKLFVVDMGSGISHLATTEMENLKPAQSLPIAESIIVLRSGDSNDKYLILCGLRNGDLYSIEFSFDHSHGSPSPCEYCTMI